MRRKCERRRGNINADAANAEVFAGDECSQGASFGPIAAISRRWRGGRIYNNTRTRERLRRKCVKPADLTTHSPPKICSRPRSPDARPPTSPPIPRRRSAPTPAQRHPLPAHFRSPSRTDAHPQAARCTPADLTTHSPPKPFARPHTATRPARALPPAPAAPTHARRPHNTFPAEDLLPPQHSDTPFPCPPATSPQRRRTPADLTTHSPPKNFALPAAPRCLSFRSASGTKKRHRTVDVRCRMSRSTVVAVGHWGW